MTAYAKSDLLLAFALADEEQQRFEGFTKIFCGVGKVNAAYQLMRALAAWHKERGRYPQLVLNLGSSGSPTFKAGTIVNCTRFIQRDMDTTIFGSEPYATIFENVPAVLTNGLRFDGYPDATCGSGDNFVTDGGKEMPWNVMDMEAYALAKVCLLEKVPFGCLKFITDGADGHAAVDWKTALADAALGLRKAADAVLSQLAA
jgi:adenosylhomocysteine nucleosidase